MLLFVRGDGVKLKPLIMFKGVPNARIAQGFEGFDDERVLHIVQENAWTNNNVLEYWCDSLQEEQAERSFYLTH